MPARAVPLADLLLGLALLATIGFAAMRPLLTEPAPARRLIGWLLVAVPLPLVVAARVSAPWSPLGGEIGFLIAVVAFAIGALLLLSGRSDTGPDTRQADAPPPWWPEFESEFRAYARRQSRRRVRV